MVHLGPKKPPSRKGSMVDVPKNLMQEIAKLEALFTVDAPKLKAITDHFVTELTKGLSKKGGNIPMIPAWVMDYPDGSETGDYIAIDLGGTNLRVVLVSLLGDGKFDVSQSKYRIPSYIRTTKNHQDLWDFIAVSLSNFYKETFPDGTTEKIPLGFTFSYPCSQTSIDTGVLQRWTKGFDIDGVEGHDVVPMLNNALKQHDVPIEVFALINDTTGTLVASRYTDPQAEMGLIFGTGCNGAYYEKVNAIPKLEGKLDPTVDLNGPMAINCEYGSFDNEHLVLPRTKYDIIIDRDSPRPGQQAFEKMISGYYLGEVFRLVLLDLHAQRLVFEGQDLRDLQEAFKLDASFLATIEEDPFENLNDVEDLFTDVLGISTTDPERRLIRRLAELIGTRASRLSVCGVAALAKKANLKVCHAAADGSVFNKYPNFQERAAQGLDDIFDWNLPIDQHPIKLVAAEDGSGVGAAVVAALTAKRIAAGKAVGQLEA